MIVGLVVLGLFFTVFAVFPRIGFEWTRLWVRTDGPIEPTRLYIVWTRVFSGLWAAGLFAAAIALIVSNHRSAERVEDCTRLLSDAHDLYDGDGWVDEDAAAKLADETGADVEVETEISVEGEGDAYHRLTLRRGDVDVDLRPDSDIATICGRLS